MINNSTWPTNDTIIELQVHNIVLYPDKHSWCTSTPIKQVISDVDCDPVEIDNLVCLGACFSYSIPRTVPANNGDEVNSYCDSCQPVNTIWIPVSIMSNIIIIQPYRTAGRTSCCNIISLNVDIVYMVMLQPHIISTTINVFKNKYFSKTTLNILE